MLVNDLFLLIADNSKYQVAGKDVQYKFFREKNILLVLFEDTESNFDWLMDFTFFPFPIKPYKKMPKMWLAHAGFAHMYKSAADTICEDISEQISDSLKNDNPENQIKQVRFSGWSLGAVMAHLCSEDFAFRLKYARSKGFVNHDICVGTSILFGCPKHIFFLYSKNFLDHAPPAISFRNSTDWITMIPPTCLGYIPIGRTFYVGPKFKISKIFSIYWSHTQYNTATYPTPDTDHI